MIRVAPSKSAIMPHRSGATLVEVLMALLIMAVGVTSVFTLFPLAILKAVKANQMTNAKLYEGSIKDLLLGNSQLWTGAPQWSELSYYGSKQYSDVTPQDLWVTPQVKDTLLPSTNQIFYCPENNPFTSSAVSPGFKVNQSLLSSSFQGGYQNRLSLLPVTQDGATNWTPYRHSPYIADASGKTSAYIVDPLGWYRATTASDRVQFGIVPATDTTSPSFHLDRIHCQLSSNAANQFFRLPDSWNETVENTPVTVSAPAAGQLEIVFPDTMDVTGQTSLNRIVLRSTSSPKAVEFSLNGATNPTNWTLQINGDLPTGFSPDQARIEVQSPSRYSWLMAVHAGPRGEFEAQCAVVFNRTFETLDEQGYRAEFCQTEDLNNDGDVADTGEDTLWPNGRNDLNMAKVRWIYNADSESPRLKEGGYICDASHGYWYQIQKIVVNEERVNANDVPNSSGLYARSILKLSDPVNVSTGNGTNTKAFSDYLLNDDTNDCQAVIIPGVIHVFSFAP